MTRETLRDSDIIYHATFDARARIVETDDGRADMEWLSGDLEGRIWPGKSLSALNRGVGETIEIVDPAPVPDGETETAETSPADDGPTDYGSEGGPGDWVTRTIPCPECNQFTRSGHDADGEPFAVCSRCGWRGDQEYLVDQGAYELD